MGGSKKRGMSVKQIRELERAAKEEVQSGDRVPKMKGPRAKLSKVAVSLRLDADVLAWLKSGGRGYGTRANRILRERMLEEG